MSEGGVPTIGAPVSGSIFRSTLQLEKAPRRAALTLGHARAAAGMNLHRGFVRQSAHAAIETIVQHALMPRASGTVTIDTERVSFEWASSYACIL